MGNKANRTAHCLRKTKTAECKHHAHTSHLKQDHQTPGPSATDAGLRQQVHGLQLRPAYQDRAGLAPSLQRSQPRSWYECFAFFILPLFSPLLTTFSHPLLTLDEI